MIRGVIFDIDGVLIRGTQAIAGAKETVEKLRASGLGVVCCTNENMKTPRDLADKLAGMGLPIVPEDVVTAGVTAAYVVARDYPGKRVLAIGGPGLLEPLQELGANLVSIEEATSAEVVVMGRDPGFNNAKLTAACKAIWAGAKFLATNYDPKLPVENGGFVPATGAFVKAVAYATSVEPVILAKPSPQPAESALRKLGLPASDVVMVGDQYRQDMGMGKAAGTHTVLVLTGATKQEEVASIPAELRPDTVLASVADLPRWLEEAAVVV